MQKLQFLGATGTVIGSKYLLQTSPKLLLVDCGLFQGYKMLLLRNGAPPPFDFKKLDADILTHAHVDHSGYLPLLVKQGYKGPVYCTSATRDLCTILLMDSAKLQVAMDNLSAHVDTNEIITWLKNFRKPPIRTFVTHGEPAAADALRFRIQEELS